jgi:Ni,Fe-hydrogenase I large subunit
MKACKLFNVLIIHFNQNLARLFYGLWQLDKLSICKTGQKNPSAAMDETTPMSTPS